MIPWPLHCNIGEDPIHLKKQLHKVWQWVRRENSVWQRYVRGEVTRWGWWRGEGGDQAVCLLFVCFSYVTPTLGISTPQPVPTLTFCWAAPGSAVGADYQLSPTCTGPARWATFLLRIVFNKSDSNNYWTHCLYYIILHYIIL